MRKYLQILLPISFLSFSLFVLLLLYIARPRASLHSVVDKLPVVSVVVAQARDIRIPVSTRGQVIPLREQPLQAGTGGFVTYVAPSLVVGGGIRKGELLLVLNDSQLDSKIRHAQVDELKAEQTIMQTEQESLRRGNTTAASALVEAAEESARLQEEAAHLYVVDLQNEKQQARITAPFDGWVMEEKIEKGMYVQPGMPLAQLFAENCVDIRIALSDNQLELLDLPTANTDDQDQASKADISLIDTDKRFHWLGIVAGAEGQVDPLSRRTIVHVRINNPYAPDPSQEGRPELRLGMLTEVELTSRLMPALYDVPRAAIHNGSQLWIVNSKDRLERRSVEILYKGRDSIYVTRGIGDGDRIVTTQLNNAAEGLRVVVGSERKEASS